LGKLGGALRRIEQATGVRRETAGAYLKAAGIGVRPPGAWGRRGPAKPANEVTPDFSPPISPPTGDKERATSACEPYRELIEQGLRRGRNGKALWQDLVSDHGFPHGNQTVKRFVRKLHGAWLPEAVGIIQTVAGEVFVKTEDWLPFVDTFRTLCFSPPQGMKQILLEIQNARFMATSGNRSPASGGDFMTADDGWWIKSKMMNGTEDIKIFS
jgi:hypothetical protein